VCDEQNFLNDVAEGNNFILITFTRFDSVTKCSYGLIVCMP
jgi:hypothetical protein